MGKDVRIIKEAEDFGLGFNSMSRLYMRSYDQRILDDMFLVCERYLPYFSGRTVCCSIRDLLEEGFFYHTEHKIPEKQQKRYDKLLKMLTKQGITLELAKSGERAEYRRKQIIAQYGCDAYFMRCYTGKNMFQSKEEFLEWVQVNKLDETAEVAVREDGTLPLVEADMELFYKVCFYMIDYSYGRHTYMPSTCEQFALKNISLFDDRTLKKLADYIANLLKKYPETSEFDSCKMDEKTWIDFELRLRDEMIMREFSGRAGKVYKLPEKFTKLLQETADVTTHHSMEDWRRACNAFKGIESFVNKLSDRSKWKKICKKEMEPVRKQIWGSLGNQWKKEEGWKYDKVGDGVYIKKKGID